MVAPPPSGISPRASGGGPFGWARVRVGKGRGPWVASSCGNRVARVACLVVAAAGGAPPGKPGKL